MKKKPRFFCDNCGYEVGSEAKLCPYCGRYFSSIRCPNCEYSGPDRMFQNGCPLCGYSAPAKKDPKSKPIREKQPSYSKPAEPLPFWTYIVAVIIFLVMVALFSYFLTR